MEQFVSARVSFDAGHVDEGRDRCRRAHGHHWVAIVEKQDNHDGGLEKDLNAIADQWRDRNLNDQLSGLARPSVDTLPGWIAERLSLNHPRIVAVSVTDGTATGSVRRDLR